MPRPSTRFTLVALALAAIGLAACGGDDEPEPLERFEPLAALTQQFDDLLAAGLDDDNVTGFRGIDSFYIDADGETQSWRILSGELFNLTFNLNRITIEVSSEGGGRIEFSLTDDTVFSPDAEAITVGRCTLVLTDGRRNAAAVADIEDTHPTWCGNEIDPP
jgi:hypothetical protein